MCTSVPSLLFPETASPIFWVYDFSLCNKWSGHECCGASRMTYRGLGGRGRRVSVTLEFVAEVLGGRLLGIGLENQGQRRSQG